MKIVWDPSAELVEAAAQVRQHAWPDFDGHDPLLDPRTVVLLADDAVVAALDVLSTAISHDGQLLRARGLSSVATDPAHLRRGYGATLVRQVRDDLAATDIDLGIFTCDSQLSGFYVGAGWEIVPDAVLVGGTRDDPFRSDQFDKVVLVARYTEARRAAQLDGRDIALYPGQRDKLW